MSIATGKNTYNLYESVEMYYMFGKRYPKYYTIFLCDVIIHCIPNSSQPRALQPNHTDTSKDTSVERKYYCSTRLDSCFAPCRSSSVEDDNKLKNFTVRVRLGWKPSFPHPPWERHHPLTRIKGADAAPKRWEVSRSDPPPSGQRPKSH